MRMALVRASASLIGFNCTAWIQMKTYEYIDIFKIKLIASDLHQIKGVRLVRFGFAACHIYSVTTMFPPWPLVISDVLDIMDIWFNPSPPPPPL